MIEKYLLYIDFLGFSELVHSAPQKIENLYAILNSLNVHRHEIFETIVFSDTALIYNKYDPNTVADENYIVWYSIEFVEDLQERLIGQDIYFRALITKGLFKHYELKNIQCFFGNALVDSYKKEKNIQSVGLFIDTVSNEHNEYFKTAFFDKQLNFVYLRRNLESFHELTNGDIPVDFPYIDDNFPFLVKDIRYLKDIYFNMRNHADPSVRVKYITAWDYYYKRYYKILNKLVSNDFDLRCLSENFDWKMQLSIMEADIKYFSKLAV